MYCGINGKTSEKQQIHNNLFSTSLFPLVGLPRPNWQAQDTMRWLSEWKKIVGAEKMNEILKQQNAGDKYKKLTG